MVKVVYAGKEPSNLKKYRIGWLYYNGRAGHVDLESVIEAHANMVFNTKQNDAQVMVATLFCETDNVTVNCLVRGMMA